MLRRIFAVMALVAFMLLSPAVAVVAVVAVAVVLPGNGPARRLKRTASVVMDRYSLGVMHRFLSPARCGLVNLYRSLTLSEKVVGLYARLKPPPSPLAFNF